MRSGCYIPPHPHPPTHTHIAKVMLIEFSLAKLNDSTYKQRQSINILINKNGRILVTDAEKAGLHITYKIPIPLKDVKPLLTQIFNNMIITVLSQWR